MKINTLLFLMCVFSILFIEQIQAQTNLKGSAWTVVQIASTNPDTPPQSIQAGEQILEISDKGEYSVQNFLGIAEQKGRIVTAENTLVLGKDGGYFAVFTMLQNTDDSLKIKYLPYEPSANYLEVILTKYQTQSHEVVATETENQETIATNFAGKWSFSQGSLLLNLDIQQDGDLLTGTHCAGADCEGKYQLKGSVSGSSASISLINEAGAEQGTAQVQSLGDNISWGITSDISKLNTVDSIVLKKAE